MNPICLFTLALGMHICLLPNLLKGEIIPIPLEHRISQSSTILIGRLTEKIPFRTHDQRHIMTLNLIEVSAYLKGHRNDSQIGLVSMGGILAGEGQLSFPSVTLEAGTDYLLFLEPEASLPDAHSLRDGYPGMLQAAAYGCIQGALPLQGGRYRDRAIKQVFSEEEIFRSIQRITGSEARSPEGLTAFPRTFPSPSSSQSRAITNIAKVSGVGGFRGGMIDPNEVLIIQGSGFLPFPGFPGTVEFSNAHDGGATLINSPVPATDIISWTDTEIRIKIPDQAGTGIVQVSPFGGTQTSFPITIDWAVVPSNNTVSGFAQATRQRIELLDFNTMGGYTFQFGNTLFANLPARDAFIRALETWRCATFVNLTFSTVPTGLTFAQNAVNQVLFENPAALPAGVIARATIYFNSSSSIACNMFNTLWRLTEMDIQFSNDVTPPAHVPPPVYAWNFGPGLSGGPGSATFDFESMALKELGRAFGLGYSNFPGTAMYYTLNEGVDVRTLTGNEVSAGTHKVTHSISPNCLSPPLPMTALTSGTCVLQWDPEEPSAPAPSGSFTLYPNPASDEIRLSVAGLETGPIKFELYAIDGSRAYRKWFIIDAGNSEIRIVTSHLPTGMYHYLCETPTEVFRGKWVKE